MSYIANENRYLQLISQLLSAEVDGDKFCQEFFSLWKSDRDEQYAAQDSWPERYDLQLLEAHGRGEISYDEFKGKWVELFGYADYEHLLDMLDRNFTACDVFDPFPEGKFEIDEAQLRSEVATNLAAYEAARVKRGS